jgi:hypothetical protein
MSRWMSASSSMLLLLHFMSLFRNHLQVPALKCFSMLLLLPHFMYLLGGHVKVDLCQLLPCTGHGLPRIGIAQRILLQLNKPNLRSRCGDM